MESDGKGNVTHYFLATDQEVKDYFAKQKPEPIDFLSAIVKVASCQVSTTMTILIWHDKKDWDMHWKLMKLLDEDQKKRKKS